MWWQLGWLFLKEFISGEVYRLWSVHKEREKAQAVADSPITKQELVEAFKKNEI